MTIVLAVLAIICCLALSFFFSGSETAVISVNRFRLRGLHEQGDADAGRLLAMLENTQRLLVMILVGTNLVNVLAALFFKMLIADGWPEWADRTALGPVRWSEMLSLVVLTPVLIVFAEILPKALFRAHADRMIGPLSPAFRVCLALFKPVIVLIEWLARGVLSLVSEQRSRAVRELTRRDVLNLIQTEERTEPEEPSDESEEPRQGGATLGKAIAREMADEEDRLNEETDERRLIQNILELHETRAYEIMTPLAELIAVNLNRVDLAGFRALARESGYSRFPVYRDRIVNLIGTIDVFRVLHGGDALKRLEDYVEPAYFVPETKRVDDLLLEFLGRRAKNAIVVDEYGGCCGWISREDILEEIVGEFEDELDEPRLQIVEKDEGVYQVWGRTEMDVVNEELGAEFSDDEWKTLAGLVLAQMGRIPSVGDEVTIGRWRARVMRMNGHRIDEVELRRLKD